MGYANNGVNPMVAAIAETMTVARVSAKRGVKKQPWATTAASCRWSLLALLHASFLWRGQHNAFSFEAEQEETSLSLSLYALYEQKYTTKKFRYCFEVRITCSPPKM